MTKKVRKIKGISIYLDKKDISNHLLGQIAYFKKEKASTSKKYILDSWQRSYLDRFLDNFPQIKGKKVLDCGTGSGYMAIELAKRGAQVTACDLTLNSLVRLKGILKKKHLEKKVKLVCCSAEKLPFADNYFDYYISNAVMEHLPNDINAIDEATRVTKARAGCMVAVPILYSYLFPPLVPINIIHDKRIGHLRRYDKTLIKRKFRAWKVVKCYYTGHITKVIKVLINIIFPIFSTEAIEKADRSQETSSRFSSNIICFLRK